MTRLGIFLFAALLWAIPMAYALDSCVVPTSKTYYIDEHSECREVTNSTGQSIMVPTKTAAEWSTGGSSFIDNTPTNVSLAACSGGGACVPDTQQARIQSSDIAAGDQYGTALAISSDATALWVGAPYEATTGTNGGAAYFYTRSGSTWTQQQKITTASYNYVGKLIKMSDDGNSVFIGLPIANKALFYTRSGSTWTLQQTITQSGTTQFGAGLAISGDGNSALIADWQNNTERGKVFFYTRSGNTWTLKQSFQSSDVATYDGFGAVIAMSKDGNSAIIYSGGDNTCGTLCGAVYAFTRSGNTWTQQQKILPYDTPAAYELFGSRIAIDDDGNTILISGNYGFVPYAADKPAVYVYTKSGSTFSLQQKLQPAGVTAGDGFASDVALSDDGDIAFISAEGPNEGVYHYTRSGSTWTEQTHITSTDPSSTFVSLVTNSDGSYIAAGNMRYGTPGANAGAAYVFTCGGGGSGSITSCTEK